MWLNGRGGGLGPILCRLLQLRRAGVAYLFWDTHQKVGNQLVTALVREALEG